MLLLVFHSHYNKDVNKHTTAQKIEKGANNKSQVTIRVVQAGMKCFSLADIQFASTVVEISAYEKNIK